MSSDTDLLMTVGNLSPTFGEVRQKIVDYVSREYDGISKPYAWPYYDHYQTGSDSWTLVDADFFAPVLLNVDITLQGYAGLKANRRAIEDKLAALPRLEVDLATAIEDDLRRVGDLYEVIENGAIPHVQGVTMSKVLHRKRPQLIPLYDRWVEHAYEGDGENLVPAAKAGTRAWSEYMYLLAKAMKHDLASQQDVWAELSNLAPGLTPLRALDIVAWNPSSGSLQASPALPL